MCFKDPGTRTDSACLFDAARRSRKVEVEAEVKVEVKVEVEVEERCGTASSCRRRSEWLRRSSSDCGFDIPAYAAYNPAVLERPMCPRCRKVELVPVQVGPVALDQCSECRGVWFDARGDELGAVLERGWERVPDVLKQAGASADPSRDTPADLNKLEPLLCPRCGSDMASYWYGGEAARTFVVDACPRGHGVWLDSGELEKAFRALEVFAATRVEMERTGKVDDALARAERGDWGPKSVFGSRFWEYLAALLNTKIER